MLDRASVCIRIVAHGLSRDDHLVQLEAVGVQADDEALDLEEQHNIAVEARTINCQARYRAHELQPVGKREALCGGRQPDARALMLRDVRPPPHTHPQPHCVVMRVALP